MVVFTCNNCGESLQKPKVEKHFSFTRCRNTNKSLSCVDCFKDFLNDEYESHTKCVTEEERYAAKGTFPKGIVKKGEVKQESWTELILSVVENTTDATPGMRKVFAVMSNASNVPRKKNKFINFFNSSLGKRVSEADVESVWNVIEKQKGPQVKVPTSSYENKSQENNDSTDAAVNGTDEGSKKKKKKIKNEEGKVNSESTLNETADEPIKKKKKSKNLENTQVEDSKTVESISEEKVNAETSLNGTADENLKKKKKKSKNFENNVETLNKTGESGNEVAVESSKKKKRKSKNLEEGVTINDSVNSIIENSDNSAEPVKKKKNKIENVAEILVNQPCKAELENSNEVTTTDTSEKSKTKKRKLKDSVTENGVSEEKKTKKNNEVEENSKNEAVLPNGKAKNSETFGNGFCYKEKILEIVKAKNSISLKKLQKKVLDAQLKATGMEPSEKVVKKFNKKLKKVSGIEISDDTVRLIDNVS